MTSKKIKDKMIVYFVSEAEKRHLEIEEIRRRRRRPKMTSNVKDCCGKRPSEGKEECENCHDIKLCSMMTLKDLFPDAYITN